MNVNKIVKLKKQLARDVEQMHNSIATGPKEFQKRSIASNKERLLIRKKYQQLKKKYYKMDEDLAGAHFHQDLIYSDILNEPIVRIEQIMYKNDPSIARWKKLGFHVVKI